MRTFLLTTLLALLAQTPEDRAKVLAEQTKEGEAAWNAMELGMPARLETAHLRIFAPKEQQGKLKAVGVLLEKYHDLAMKAVDLDEKDPYPGKVTVYLLPEKENLPSFLRRVEKRRPAGGETGTYSAEDDQLHVAAGPGKVGLTPEARAGEMLAALLLHRRAGKATVLPEWLTMGFGRAISYRVSPTAKFVLEDRKLARLIVRKRNASDVWAGMLESDEQEVAQASVAELFAFGLGGRLGKVLEGFRPEENEEARSTAKALEQADIAVDRLNRAWKVFVK